MTWGAPSRRAIRYDSLMFVRLRHLLGWVFSVFRSSHFGNNCWLCTQSDLILDRVPSTNCPNAWSCLGQAQENTYAVESLKRVYSVGLWTKEQRFWCKLAIEELHFVVRT